MIPPSPESPHQAAIRQNVTCHITTSRVQLAKIHVASTSSPALNMLAARRTPST